MHHAGRSALVVRDLGELDVIHPDHTLRSGDGVGVGVVGELPGGGQRQDRRQGAKGGDEESGPPCGGRPASWGIHRRSPGREEEVAWGSVAQGIWSRLDVHYMRLRALATLQLPGHPVAIRGPEPSALPAGARVVDAAVQPLGAGAHRIRHPERHVTGVGQRARNRRRGSRWRWARSRPVRGCPTGRPGRNGSIRRCCPAGPRNRGPGTGGDSIPPGCGRRSRPGRSAAPCTLADRDSPGGRLPAMPTPPRRSRCRRRGSRIRGGAHRRLVSHLAGSHTRSSSVSAANVHRCDAIRR